MNTNSGLKCGMKRMEISLRIVFLIIKTFSLVTLVKYCVNFLGADRIENTVVQYLIEFQNEMNTFMVPIPLQDHNKNHCIMFYLGGFDLFPGFTEFCGFPWY